MTIVGRAIEGISLNGLEYLCEKDGVTVMRFPNEESARGFFVELGFSADDIEEFTFVEEESMNV